MPMPRLFLVLVFAAAASALRVPVQRVGQSMASHTRRGMLRQVASGTAFAALATATPAFAAVSEIGAKFGSGAISKEELYAAAAARKEAERVSKLPINRLKVMREQLSGGSALIKSGNWNGLRDLIASTTGSEFSKFKKEAGLTSEPARELSIKLRKAIIAIDTVAYSQQSIMPAGLSGYCADGVVPREEGGCKVKPVVETAPLLANLDVALTAFDGILALYN